MPRTAKLARMRMSIFIRTAMVILIRTHIGTIMGTRTMTATVITMMTMAIIMIMTTTTTMTMTMIIITTKGRTQAEPATATLMGITLMSIMDQLRSSSWRRGSLPRTTL